MSGSGVLLTIEVCAFSEGPEVVSLYLRRWIGYGSAEFVCNIIGNVFSFMKVSKGLWWPFKVSYSRMLVCWDLCPTASLAEIGVKRPALLVVLILVCDVVGYDMS